MVRDHSFDYVDLDEFYDPSCTCRLGYLLIYVLVIKSFLVYVADFWSASKYNASKARYNNKNNNEMNNRNAFLTPL